MDIQQFANKNRLKTRVDADVTKIIPGKLGHIYEYDDEGNLGVMIMPDPPRRQYWGFTKKLFLEAGMRVIQDGDGEGSAVLDPNNAAQVKIAVKAAKIRRRKDVSPERLEQLRKQILSAVKRAHRAAGSDDR